MHGDFAARVPQGGALRTAVPRVFCMASGHDGHDSCTCLSEQGTRYIIEPNRCRMIALQGQYEPFLDEVQGDRRRLDEATQRR